MATDTRRIAVYGAGAVGGYLGGKLARNPDLNITLIGRPQVAEAVQRHGLIIKALDEEEVSHPAVVTSAEGLGTFDAVLLTVRTYDVEASVPDLEALLGEHGLLLAFQNGAGTEERLAEVLGRERVLPCTLTVSEGMEDPGAITRYSRSGGVALATMTGNAVPAWIVAAFEGTGLPAVVVVDYRSLRWSKLLLNMLAAPTSAILDMDIAALMNDPAVFRIERDAFLEAGRVMDAAGIKAVKLPGYPVPLARFGMRLPAPLAQRTIGRRIASARGGRSPGMRSDIRRGKSEVADFNGAITREGERLGMPTPVNQALTELTEQLAAHPEERERFRERPDELAAYINARR
jgi:2-dehydropantoate 2-reductase